MMNAFLQCELERIITPHLKDAKINIIKTDGLNLMFNVGSGQFPMKTQIGRIRYIKYLIQNDQRKWNEKLFIVPNPMDLETYTSLT